MLRDNDVSIAPIPRRLLVFFGCMHAHDNGGQIILHDVLGRAVAAPSYLTAFLECEFNKGTCTRCAKVRLSLQDT